MTILRSAHLASFAIAALPSLLAGTTTSAEPHSRPAVDGRRRRPSPLLIGAVRGGGLGWGGGGGSGSGSSDRRPLAGAEIVDVADFLDDADAGGEKERGATTGGDGDVRLYPAMTGKEVSKSLMGITVYCITRASDGGVLLAKAGGTAGGGNEQQAVYFFLDRETAEANLDKVREGGGNGDVEELRVSSASLGRIWDKFFPPPATDGARGSSGAAVEYRLVPDAQELLKARFLLTVTEKDVEKGGLTVESSKRLVRKVNANPSKFKGGYNEIPLFVAPQMRLLDRGGSKFRPFRRRRRREILPVYFRLDDMTEAMRRVPGFADRNPATSVMDLRELLGQMVGQDSVNLDLRDVVFVPPGGGGRGANSASNMAAVEGSDEYRTEGGDATAPAYPQNLDRGDNGMPAIGSWLRPRRRICAQDYEALFGHDA